jgi:hypothetical protein
MIHNAECHIDGRVNVEEKVLFDHSGVTVLDLNRIFPDWERRMPHFVKARWPAGQMPADRIIRQAIITGMMYAVEEIMKSKI